jgi:hypothetical protein
MPIHHIDMHPLGPALINGAYFIAQLGKICSQD